MITNAIVNETAIEYVVTFLKDNSLAYFIVIIDTYKSFKYHYRVATNLWSYKNKNIYESIGLLTLLQLVL